jgi:hypothetical protein
MFRKSSSLSSDKFILMVMERMQCMTKADLAKYMSDKSGRQQTPAIGTAPGQKRYWANMHHVFTEHLSQGRAVASLAGSLSRFFEEKLEVFPKEEWVTVHVFEFMQDVVAECAVASLAGRRILERNPDFIKAMWDYDSMGSRLMYGVLPRWMDPEPWAMRDRFHRMAIAFLKDDFDTVDWDSMPQTDWHPVFGSKLLRELSNWQRNYGLSMETRAGSYIGIMQG